MIQSNVIVAVVLVVSGVVLWHGPPSRSLELAHGAAAVYIPITGVVYSLLLSGIESTPRCRG